MASYKYNKIVDQVRDMYIQGLSKKKISVKLDVDMAQIGYILYVQLKIHESFPRRQTGADLLEALPKEKINKIITLSSFGYNVKEIANDQNISQRDVFKIVTEAKKKKLIKKVS
jgi:orotate phosphoribosyltransferase-like protein